MTIETIYEPNYQGQCDSCGKSPTVIAINKTNPKDRSDIGLCGACCFGDSECADPDNW